jgi:vacuolar-type H+-ATPase subunit H
MATKEAERLISESKTRAESESAKILQKGEENLVEIQQNIDVNFDSAVKDAVLTVMKA